MQHLSSPRVQVCPKGAGLANDHVAFAPTAAGRAGVSVTLDGVKAESTVEVVEVEAG